MKTARNLILLHGDVCESITVNLCVNGDVYQISDGNLHPYRINDAYEAYLTCGCGCLEGSGRDKFSNLNRVSTSKC